MKNKSVIHTYRTIYGIDLVIANQSTTLKKLRELYKFDNEELTEEILSGYATTSTVINKATKRNSILVKLNNSPFPKDSDKKLELVNTAAHEATHVLLDIYSHVGETISYCGQESIGYFIGWATEMIYKCATTK